jgi:hypothetical protein
MNPRIVKMPDGAFILRDIPANVSLFGVARSTATAHCDTKGKVLQITGNGLRKVDKERCKQLGRFYARQMKDSV